MKKLLETSLGHWDDKWFSLDGKRVSDKDALELIKDKCNSYETKDDGGVIVYMSKQEYETFLEESNVEEQLVETQFKLLNKGFALEHHLKTVQKLPKESRLKHYEKLLQEEQITRKQYNTLIQE